MTTATYETRDAEIAGLRRAGKKLREIANEFGITRERVRQLIVRYESQHGPIVFDRPPHGQTRENRSLYWSWNNAVKAHGIESLCESWREFPRFREWAVTGWQRGSNLVRRDTRFPYSPANCFWGTRRDVGASHASIRLSAFGEIKTMREWSEDIRCAVNESALEQRVLYLGWDDLTAITAPKSTIVNRR